MTQMDTDGGNGPTVFSLTACAFIRLIRAISGKRLHFQPRKGTDMGVGTDAGNATLE